MALLAAYVVISAEVAPFLEAARAGSPSRLDRVMDAMP